MKLLDLRCKRCGLGLEAHSVFYDVPTVEQLDGLVEGDFEMAVGPSLTGAYCPRRIEETDGAQ